MPLATPRQYAAMLDAAARRGYAHAAVNVTSSETLNAALRGFALANADGIVQITVGAAEYLSGTGAKDALLGARALADYAHVVAEASPVLVALHTDHCPPAHVDDWLRPLLAESPPAGRTRRRSSLPLAHVRRLHASAGENLRIAAELLAVCAELDVVLEVECGVVGGEEDGIAGPGNAHGDLYTTPADLLRVADVLGVGERGRYLVAATFGNVHGTYAPGNVVLRPEILRAGQQALATAYPGARFQYVFHGSSGSSAETRRCGLVRSGQGQRRHRQSSTRSPGRSPVTCSTTGKACSGSMGAWATSTASTREHGAAPERQRWRSGSGKRASRSDRPDAASQPRRRGVTRPAGRWSIPAESRSTLDLAGAPCCLAPVPSGASPPAPIATRYRVLVGPAHRGARRTYLAASTAGRRQPYRSGARARKDQDGNAPATRRRFRRAPHARRASERTASAAPGSLQGEHRPAETQHTPEHSSRAALRLKACFPWPQQRSLLSRSTTWTQARQMQALSLRGAHPAGLLRDRVPGAGAVRRVALSAHRRRRSTARSPGGGRR